MIRLIPLVVQIVWVVSPFPMVLPATRGQLESLWPPTSVMRDTDLQVTPNECVRVMDIGVEPFPYAL